MSPLPLRAWPATLALAVGLLASCAENDDPAWRFAPSTPSILRGSVHDTLSGAPVAGARVTLGAAVTFTDAAGTYAITSDGADSTLRAEHPAYLAASRLPAGVARSGDLELFPAEPGEEAVERHLLALQASRAGRDDPDDPALRPEARAFLRGETPALGPRSHRDDVGVARSALDAPPATIRIWRRSIDGASASCSGRIDVIDFEEYIKGVLPHEWIPSWHDESLAAGALAIRTYAWNWVARGGKYDCADLDDTTRSQVYRDDRNDRANAAVDGTRGAAISRGGSLVSGEYSAENSDPTADGVSEPLCTGRALAGHGRGMCQWGSQRWALDGRDHTWIATHYWPGSAVEGGGPAAPAYAATFVGMEVPPEMVSGDRSVAWVELRNDGTATWDLGGTRLGTTRPNDHESPFFDPESWVAPHRASPPDHSDYGPGAVGRFSFVLHAPDVASEQVVTDTFGLVQEGVTWFGPDDLRIEVRVHPRAPGVVDSDGDGTSSDADCDDADATRHPGALETCGDGIDQDCDGSDLACASTPPPVPGSDAGPPPPGAGRDAGPTATSDAPRVAVMPPPEDASHGPGDGATEITGTCTTTAGRDASPRGLGVALVAVALGLAGRRRRRRRAR